MQKPTIHGFLCWALISAVHAAPLLTDNFDDANPDSSTFNNNLATTQGGSLAPITYTVSSPGGGYTAQHGNSGHMLLVGTGGSPGRASLNHDFSIEANLANRPITVSFNLMGVSDAGDPTIWGHFGLGSTQNGDYFGTDFAILFRANNQWSARDNNANADIASGTYNDGNLIKFVFSNTAGTGSAFNGGGSKVAISIAGSAVGTYALNQLTYGDGFLTWGGFPYPGYSVMSVDNLSVEMDPNSPAGEILTWTGAQNANWDEVSANWSNPNSYSIWYNNSNSPNSIVFGASGATRKAVNLALPTPLFANTITVSTTGYTFGANPITLGNSPNFVVNADATISAVLQGGGGIIKSGSSMLTLTQTNTYTGGTTVNGGILQLNGGSGGNSPVRGTLTVNNSATVSFTDDGTGLGFNGGAKVDALQINGGTVTSSGAIHIWNMTGGVNLTGGTLQSNNGTSTTSGPQLEWSGTALNTYASATPSVIAGRIRFRPDNGTIHTFNVADGPAATDLLISAALTETSRCGLVKTGSGTLRMTGSVQLSGVITVEEGTLDVSAAALGPDVQFNVSNNACLKLPPSLPNKIFVSGRKLAAGTWGPPGSVVAGTAAFESPVFTGGSVVSLTNTERSSRERWLDMHYGLLVHYAWDGSGLVTRDIDGSPADNLEALANSFDVQGFADDVASMGVEYVIFTAWHSNFFPLFNSSAVVNNFGFQRNSSRDLIGEMVAAVKAKGIRVLLYANIGQASVYTDNRWNDVMEDIFTEMLDRYDIDGFFMDENDPGGNMSWDFPRIARAIYQRKPDAVTIQNFYGNLYTWDGAVGESGPATADFSNNIMWTSSSPYAQVISQTWSAQVAKVPTPGFAATRSAEGIYRGAVVAAGSRTEGGGVMWSAGPFTGNGTWFNPATNKTEFVGRWEAGVLEAMQGAGAYIAPVAESIKGVRPSNSWRPQGWIGNLEWGVATRKPDDSREYIHVLNPPATKTLSLPPPNDGKVFANARLLPSNNPVALVQTPRGVTLTLGAADNWNPLNTVIAMDVIAQGGRGLTNDDSTAVTYSGSSWTWQRNRGLGEYGDDAHVATANGDSFTFNFNGTDVELIASRGPTRGTVEVFVDEVSQGTVDLNQATPVQRTTVISKSGLARGPHTLRVVKQSGADFAVDAFRVTDMINNTDPDLDFGALSNYNDTQTTPNGVGYVTYDANWIWQQRYWTEYNGDIHYAQWNGSEATIHFTGTGIVWEGNSQGVVDFYLDGVFVKQTNMGALSGSNQVGYQVSGLSPGNHTLRFVKVGGVYVEFDNFRVYNQVNDQWSAESSGGAWNGDTQTTPNNEDFMLMTFNGHSADILTRQDSQGGTAQVTLDATYSDAVNHYQSVPAAQAPVFSTLTSDLLSPGAHTLRMTKKRGQNMSVDAVRVYKQWPSPDFRFWQGDTSSSFTTPANWVENEWAQWNVYVFDSNVVNGTTNLDSFFGCGDLYLSSGLTNDITINGPNPLIMATDQRAAWNIPNPTGAITIADGSRNLTINTNYLSSGPVRWDVGAGRTLKLNAALQDWNGTASLVKQGAGTAVLSAASSYTGNTTVLAGTLRLGNGIQNSNLADSADVILAAGAILDLEFTGTDTIDELIVAGVAKPPGVYASGNSPFITGTGTLTVINGPLSDYQNWANSTGLTGGPQDDDDHDGVSNSVEYAFGLDPKNSGSINPYQKRLDHASGTFTYSRRKTTLSGLTYTVWTSTNLADWTEDTNASQTASAIPGTDNESVEVALSPGLLNAARLFVRIEAR